MHEIGPKVIFFYVFRTDFKHIFSKSDGFIISNGAFTDMFFIVKKLKFPLRIIKKHCYICSRKKYELRNREFLQKINT